MLLLREIEVEGFRGIKNKVAFKVEKPLVVLLGPTGSGKSSILRAVEFALFGATREIRKRQLKKSDLLNDLSSEARVRLTLAAEDGKEYSLERSIKRNGIFKLKIIKDREILEGLEAERFLSDVLDVTFDEFINRFSVDSFTLQSLIYGPPSTRSSLLDRLFGLEALERIFRSIQLRDLDSKLGEVKGRISLLKMELVEAPSSEEVLSERRRIEGELEELSREIERLSIEKENLERRLDEMGAKMSKYHELKGEEQKLVSLINYYKETTGRYPRGKVEVLALAEALKAEVVDLLRELLLEAEAKKLEDIEVSEDNLGTLAEALEAAILRAEKERERLLIELSELKGEQEYLERYVKGLEKEVASLEVEIEALEEYESRYEALRSKYGSEDELERELTKLRLSIAEAEERRFKSSCIAKLGSELLKDVNRRGRSKCPVCGTDVNSQALARLQALVSSAVKEVEGRGEGVVAELMRKYEVLERVLGELRELKAKVSELEVKRAKYNALKARYEEKAGELKALEETIEESRLRLEGVSAQVKALKRKLADLRLALAGLEALRKVEAYRAKLEEVRAKIRALGFSEEKFKVLEERVSRIKDKLSNLKVKEAELKHELKDLEERARRRRRLEARLERANAELKRLLSLREKLLKLKNSFRILQAEVRERALVSIRSRMNEAFSKIYVHGDYDALDIRVLRRETTPSGYERSIYELYARRAVDGSWVPVSTRLSDGQKMVVAFSLLIALNRLYPSNVGFILLDEPLPNVDLTVKLAVIDLLTEQIPQVLLATQDEALARALEAKAQIIRLSHRTA